MRFVRYKYKDDEVKQGWLHEVFVGPVEGSIFNEFQRQEATIPIERVRLFSPIVPGKIICVGRNYATHAKERIVEVPEVPILFLKPQSSIIGPSEPIVLPPQSQRVEHEAELVVIIGKTGRWISPDDSLKYILGYTIGNDVTARDLQNRDGQWTRAKGFDTFCPIGPWIETVLDSSDVMITCHVNGEMRQMGSTHDIVFNIKQLLSFVSSIMTLYPGDLLFTGTPSGVGPLLPGDRVDVHIEGIGTLSNSIEAETRSIY